MTEAKVRIVVETDFGSGPGTLSATGYIKVDDGDEEVWFSLTEQANLSSLFATLSQRAETWEAGGGQWLWRCDNGTMQLHFDINAT